MRRSRSILILLAAVCSAPRALGHEVEVLCKVEPPDRLAVTVYTEGAPGAGAYVRLIGAEGREVATGRTGEDGRWTFTIHEVFPYEVEAILAGHMSRCRLDERQVAALSAGGTPESPAGNMDAADHDHPDDAHPTVAVEASHGPASPTHARAFPAVELVAGLALILAAAALAMTWSLRRKLEACLDQQARSGR